MKCPTCQAKLLPVSGEMFCLQCGSAYRPRPDEDSSAPELADTSEPLLQKAINDVRAEPITFRLPVVAAPPAQRPSLAPLRELVRPPRETLHPVMAGGVAALPPSPVAVMAPVAVEPAERGRARGTPGWQWRWNPLVAPWLAGGAVFALFVLSNVVVAAWWSGRTYPGVRVGGQAVGGQSQAVVADRLRLVASPGRVTVRMGSRTAQLDAAQFAQVDAEAVAASAMRVGRDQPLPLAGLLRAWFSSPVPVRYAIDDNKLDEAVRVVAAQLDRPAHDAALVVRNGRVLVLSDKSGERMNRQALREALRSNLSEGSVVLSRYDQVAAAVRPASYQSEADMVQAMAGLSIGIKVQQETYTATAAQIGSWLVVNGPGKGVVVDAARVAQYVEAIPGAFDRQAALAAIAAAVTAKQNITYTTNRHPVTTLKDQVMMPVTPVTYSYCVVEGTTDNGLRSLVTRTLADPAGWSLGGSVVFSQVNQGCDVAISVRDTSGMEAMAPACAKQTTCSSDGQIAIASEAWQRAPVDWKGSLEAYRIELVNHELGHWLGFEHARCLGSPTGVPVLSEPDVILGTGCSPKWYAIALELQGTKILAGF